MNNNPSGAIHPTVFIVLWGATSFGLYYFWPLKLPELNFIEILGGIVIVFASLLMVWAQIVFWKHGTTVDHSKPTTTLITNGPFRFSRNPIYLALILIFTGFSIVSKNIWGIIFVIPFVLALLRFTIQPEENYLERKFESDYLNYRNSVRRWI